MHVIVTPLASTTYTASFAGVNPQSPGQNPVRRFDIDGDNILAPLDALLIIIELNARGPYELDPDEEPAHYFDPSGDNFVSALDAALVIAALNSGESGEAQAAAADAAHTAVPSWSPAAWLMWDEQNRRK
jgi:hypothetical protein